MSDTVECPRFVPALCCACGNARQAGFANASGGHERLLKCTACGKRTTHAIVAPPGWDWREKDNLKPDGDAAKILRNVAHMERFGIYVSYGRPQGNYAEVRHYLDGDEPAWEVLIAADLEPVRRLAMLEWAWKTMLPSWVADYAKSWGGEVCHDDRYGDFRGCYYTGR